MLKILNEILEIVSTRKKVAFLFFIFITFISSFVDAVSIGLIIPFIGLFLDYNKTIVIISKFNFLDLSLEEPVIYYLITALLVFTIIFSTLFRIFQSYFGTKLNEMLRYEISSIFYFKLVNLKYLNYNYINENNSNSNIQKISFVSSFIGAYLSFITHILSLILICVLLIVIDINLFFSLIFMSFILICFNQFFKNLLVRNSKLISINIDKRTQMLNNAIGYLPFIMINNLKDFFYKNFSKVEYQISKSNLLLIFFSKIPNLIFISVVTILISIVVLYYKIDLSNEMFIEKIATFTGVIIALLRSLPQLVNLQGSLSTLRSTSKLAEDVIKYINRIKNSHYAIKKKINYESIKKIEFKNLNFNYTSEKKKNSLIKSLNFKIYKGDKIIIYGASGSGKTTILKIILGLLKPDFGEVYINSKETSYENFSSIEKKISYVSQDIFLSNASFFENLTIGLANDHIDFNKVKKYCKIVNIHDFIAGKKNGYHAEVSHSARNISGGQKQRIGLARALIGDPEILVLDESTNSMDAKTEIKVLKNIIKNLKNQTIICVSHNKNLLKLFDKRYNLEANKLVKC